MIVLDASVLIAHLDAQGAHHALATQRLLAAAGEPFGASAITLAEVLVAPARAGRIAAAQFALRTLGVDELALGPDAAARLAELRAETALKLPDCCVLLAAEHAGGSVLTFDDRLARAAAQLGLAA